MCQNKNIKCLDIYMSNVAFFTVDWFSINYELIYFPFLSLCKVLIRTNFIFFVTWIIILLLAKQSFHIITNIIVSSLHVIIWTHIADNWDIPLGLYIILLLTRENNFMFLDRLRKMHFQKSNKNISISYHTLECNWVRD